MAKSDAAKSGGAKSSGAMEIIVAMLLLTLIGGGGGGYLGYTLAVPPAGGGAAADTKTKPTRESADNEDAGKQADAHGGGQGNAEQDGGHADGHGKDHGKDHGKGHGQGHGDSGAAKAPEVPLQVKELPTIVTNLSQPETSWIRLQAAIVYDAKEVPHPEKLIAEIMSDITAFLRNVTLSSLEGSDGLRRLQEDLTERAAIRSERKVREVIIETMVVQ